jgi:hypothetical protein
MNKQFNNEMSAGNEAEQSDAAQVPTSCQPIGNTLVTGSFLSRYKIKLYERMKMHIENNWFYYLAICVGFTFERIGEAIVRAIASLMR